MNHERSEKAPDADSLRRNIIAEVRRSIIRDARKQGSLTPQVETTIVNTLTTVYHAQTADELQHLVEQAEAQAKESDPDWTRPLVAQFIRHREKHSSTTDANIPELKPFAAMLLVQAAINGERYMDFLSMQAGKVMRDIAITAIPKEEYL